MKDYLTSPLENIIRMVKYTFLALLLLLVLMSSQPAITQTPLPACTVSVADTDGDDIIYDNDSSDSFGSYDKFLRASQQGYIYADTNTDTNTDLGDFNQLTFPNDGVGNQVSNNKQFIT